MRSLCLTSTFIQSEAQVWFVSSIRQSFILVASAKWLDWVRNRYIDTGTKVEECIAILYQLWHFAKKQIWASKAFS